LVKRLSTIASITSWELAGHFPEMHSLHISKRYNANRANTSKSLSHRHSPRYYRSEKNSNHVITMRQSFNERMDKGRRVVL